MMDPVIKSTLISMGEGFLAATAIVCSVFRVYHAFMCAMMKNPLLPYCDCPYSKLNGSQN